MGLSGYNNQQVVVTIIRTNLHQLCAHDLPLNSLQFKEVDDDDNGIVYQLSGRTFDVYPLCTYIEQYLRPRTRANDANCCRDDILGTNPIAMSIVKSSIYELLRELNITVRIHDSGSNDWKRDTKETRSRAWEIPPLLIFGTHWVLQFVLNNLDDACKRRDRWTRYDSSILLLLSSIFKSSCTSSQNYIVTSFPPS